MWDSVALGGEEHRQVSGGGAARACGGQGV